MAGSVRAWTKVARQRELYNHMLGTAGLLRERIRRWQAAQGIVSRRMRLRPCVFTI